MRSSGSLRRFLALVVVAFALPSVSFGHSWEDTSKPEGQGAITEEAPSQEEAMQGFSGVYRVTVEQGKPIIVAIKNTSKPPCEAEIKVVSADGVAAKVKARDKRPLVEDQYVTVEGKSVGITTAVITVRGKDTVNGTNGSCKENTKNKLVITVVASAAQATTEFGNAWKPLSSGLRGDLRMSVGTAASEIKSHLAALGSGQVDPETAAMAICASAHGALIRDQDSIASALSSFRTTGVGLLTSGGFRPECEPRGFGSGSGGPWDLSLRDTYLQGFGSLQGVDRLMLGARTSFDKLTLSGKINGALTYQPGLFQLPAYPPPSLNPEAGTTPVHKLQTQIYGGLTFQNSMNQMEGCLWFGGRYDLSKGAPIATLTPSIGLPIVKTPSAAGLDAWQVPFTGLTPGLTYKFGVEYADHSQSDACSISLPWVDPK